MKLQHFIAYSKVDFVSSFIQNHPNQNKIIAIMEKAGVAVVVVPLPSQSHLNQLLQLSALISSHGLPVHYLGSATHNRQVKLRAYGLKPNTTSKIHFHDLPTPPIDSPDPNPDSPDKLPVHVAPAMKAYMDLRHRIGVFSRELSEKMRKIVVIYDRIMVETIGDTVSIQNAEFYGFNCLSAFTLFHILWEATGKPFDLEGKIHGLFSAKEIFPEGVFNFIVSKSENFMERDGDIHNTVRVLESRYLDLLEREEITGNKKQWAIRPIFQRNETKPRHKCLEWLDKQAPRSVIYVSFGTSISLSKEEAKEIAIGLEQSNQKFIWVLRNADKADIFAAGEAKITELPQGFEERVLENGIIVRDWAPQMEILAHKSVGGFLSHCGWNSCFESLSMGVPIAAWPMHSDQPINAVFLTEVLKVGVMVREWAKRKELVRDFVIKDAVERLMDSEEGNGIRKRAKEISFAMKKSVEEGGECSRELEDFIAHISR